MTTLKIIAILDPAQAQIAAEVLELTAGEAFNPDQDSACAAVAEEIRHAIAFTKGAVDNATETAPRPHESIPTANVAAAIRADLEGIDWMTVDDPAEVINTMLHRYILAPASQLTNRQRTALDTFARNLTLTLWTDRHARAFPSTDTAQ